MVRYRFVEWRDEVGNVWTTPSLTLLIDRDKTLTAYYEEVPVPTYTLTVATTAGGTTDPAPDSYVYDEGATTTVTAIPATGYKFSHWILDGVTRTENPISILMDRDYTLTAYFEPIPPLEYTLTIATTTGGNTDPSPGSYTHPEGTSVTVTAIPSAGYEFDHWTINGITRTENPTTVTMDKNYTLTAYFTELPPPEHILTINTTLGGTTSPEPGDYSYVENTTVTVTAIPDSGYNFDHWTLNGVAYTTNPINVLMDTDHSLTAYFSEEAPPPPETYKLTVSSTIGGTTNPPPGVHEYDVGTTVTVTATPENGYYFNHWELDGAAKTENPINIVMDKDHTLLAVFSVTPPKPPISPWLMFLIGLPIIGGVFYWITKAK